MSIKPKYAEQIICGRKKIELRKRIPTISTGDMIVFYESTPVKRITLYCEVSDIIKISPAKLWNEYNNLLAIEREHYETYFSNKSTAYGIELKNIVRTEHIKLCQLSENLRPPQSYRYLSEEEFRIVERHAYNV